MTDIHVTRRHFGSCKDLVKFTQESILSLVFSVKKHPLEVTMSQLRGVSHIMECLLSKFFLELVAEPSTVWQPT